MALTRTRDVRYAGVMGKPTNLGLSRMSAAEWTNSPMNRRKVFLSHSHADGVFAMRLAEGLRDRGLEVWSDRQIAPGQHSREAVDAALSAADSCVVVVSNAAIGSSGFTSAEWSVIQDAVWRRPDLKVVPVVLTGAELPPFLRPWRIVGPVGPSEPQRAADRIIDVIGAEGGSGQDLVGAGDEAAQQRFDEIRASLRHMRREL